MATGYFWKKPSGDDNVWYIQGGPTLGVVAHLHGDGAGRIGAVCTDGKYYSSLGRAVEPREPIPGWVKLHVDKKPVKAPRRVGKAKATEGGTKHDASKPPLSLIPVEALNSMADVLAYGAKKYGKGNYKAGFKQSRLLDAALRHLTAYASKEDKDPESGLSHLGHAAASIAMLLQNIATGVAEDDR